MATGLHDFSDSTSQNELGSSAEVSERRLHRRQRVPFAYVELGDDNGGCIFDISQGGLAIQAVGPTSEGHVSPMHFQFLHSTVWITAMGRVVWANTANKTAGVEFLDLSKEARTQIEAGISSFSPSGHPKEFHTEKETIADLPVERKRASATPFLEHANSNAGSRVVAEPAQSTSEAARPAKVWRAESGGTLRPDVSPQPGTVTPPLPAREAKSEGTWTRLLIGLLAALLLVSLIICFQLARRTESGSVSKTGAAPEPHMGLKIERIGNDWQLRWNPDAPIIAEATKAHLLITDGTFQKFLDLDASDLRSGTLIYRPLTSNVVLRFEVDRPNSAETVSESVRIEGPPSSSPAAPTPATGPQ